jgi:hypothetical protein
MAELITKQLQALQFNSEVATAADVSSFVNASTTELSTSLIARIQALEGFSTFIGVKDALPESAENGQIVIVGEKEYIWGPKADGVAGWTELGDTTAETAAISELSGKFENYVSSNDEAIADLTTTLSSKIDAFYNEAVLYTDHEISVLRDNTNSEISALKSVKADLSVVEEMLGQYSKDDEKYTNDKISALRADVEYLTGELDNKISAESAYLDAKKADVSAVNASVEALTKALDDVEASLSGYDTVGSATAAQEAAISAAKAYTDEQIAAVEGEISSLTDVVETKADQTAVDAAISAINENISTLSAKAEEDPVFTAWKDGESIALGSGSMASDMAGVAIGNDTQGLGYKAVAVGGSAHLTGDYSIAIGGDTFAEFGGIAIGGQASTYSNAIAIGLSACANENNGIAVGTNAKSYRLDGIAIGLNAQSGLSGNRDSDGEFGVVQIGSTDDHDQPVTSKDPLLKVFKHEVLNANGKLVTTNLAGIDTLKTAVSAIEEVTAEDNVQVLREAVNTLVAAIKTFVGA